MHDEDTQKLPPRPFHSRSLFVFYCALGEVPLECARFGEALGNHDYEAADLAARDAYSSWLIAKAALRHLYTRALATSEEVFMARAELREVSYVLGVIFARAAVSLESSALCRTLTQLRLGLVLRNGSVEPTVRSEPRGRAAWS
jgi:hypothetical protein